MSQMNKRGLLLCAKYSAAPNFFGYCGPDKNANLVEHIHENIMDREVEVILSEFGTLYLNLRLIAGENNIKDVFDERVVEAYWVGNTLLEHVSADRYSALLWEQFDISKKIGEKEFVKMKRKMHTYRLYPHHSFHVFNIFKRIGHDQSFRTLHTMDECRIGWGEIRKIKNKYEVTVRSKPLELRKGELAFGKDTLRDLRLDYKGKQIPSELKVGDRVSYHWGRVCDVLSEQQVKRLSYYTQHAMAYFNAKEK